MRHLSEILVTLLAPGLATEAGDGGSEGVNIHAPLTSLVTPLVCTEAHD